MDTLNSVFKILNNKVVLLFLIVALVIILYSDFVSRALVILSLLVLASVSKLYHRFLKSSLGIDLVLFTTIAVSLSYHNSLFSLIFAYIGLVAADLLGGRFSHTSIVSLFALTIVVLVSNILSVSILSALLLTAVYEIITAAFYFMLGSSMDRIAVFLLSHVAFNLMVILNFFNLVHELII